jgi:hypothetical protein
MLIRSRLHSLLFLLLGCVLPVSAQTGLENYARQDSARFRVLYAPQDAGVVPEIWQTIRERVPQVEQRLRLSLADTVTFVIAPTPQEWARFTQGAPLWANGLAYSKYGVAILKSPRFGLPYGPLPLTAVHEYVHLLLSAGAPNSQFPRWLEEGLAQVLAGQFEFVDDAALARAAISGRLHSLYQLEGLMGMSAQEARLGYAESAVAVQLLEKQFGMAGISNLVHELRGGREFDEAFKTIFGIPPGQFDGMYLSYVQRNFRLSFFGDMELWVSGAFVVLVLAGGVALWIRRRKIKARWSDEERRERGEDGDVPPPPYVINYTIVRERRDDEEKDEGEEE